MDIKNEETSDVMFELDGVLFPDLNVAINAAKQSIEIEAALRREKDVINGFNGATCIEYQYHVPEEPVGSRLIEGWPMAISPNRQKTCFTPIISKAIRRVNPRSPLYGKYIAKIWTKKELQNWWQVDKYAACDHYIGCSMEEMHYIILASLIGPYLNGVTAVSEFPIEIGNLWSKATNEMERNQVAEIFLCAQDIGLMNKIPYHDILTGVPEGLAARADELERIRDEANAEARNCQ